MTPFVIVNDIYDYHDYSAYGLLTNAIVIGHSHNHPCLLRLQSDICVCL